MYVYKPLAAARPSPSACRAPKHANGAAISRSQTLVLIITCQTKTHSRKHLQ